MTLQRPMPSDKPDCCGLVALPDDGRRRRVIQLVAAGLMVGVGRSATAARAGPAKGDRLVADDVEGEPVALRLADLRPGKPLLAFPYDPATKQVRSESRLNKIVLIRYAEADLDAPTRQRAAGGVLAFSAICTHQACEVKTWIAKDRTLVCFCHASKFQPLDAGQVIDGPAPRALPSLPLALQDEQLIVAGAFSAPPGPTS